MSSTTPPILVQSDSSFFISDGVVQIPDNVEYCQALEDFYNTYGATTEAHKIANLERELGKSNMYGTNLVGDVPDKHRLAIYEHQWKVAHGLIHPIYA